jgi:site-specific recombinase XerD
VKAAGLSHRTPYALRHTFASFAIAAGIPTFEIARMMGTSIAQIEQTYGHLLPDALERGRVALEASTHALRRRLVNYRATATEPVASSYERKALQPQGFSVIGAPRFELGTSSPPD